MNKLSTCLAVGITMISGAASAQLVYDNGVGGPAGVTTGLVADSSVPQTVTDNVAIQPDQAVTRIEWTGFYGGGDETPPATDNFFIYIRDDANGTPGAVIATFPVGDSVSRTLVPPGTSVLSSVYTYEAAISFTFLSGVEYWLEIENDNGNRDNDTWSWATGPTGMGGSVWFSANLGVNWFDSTFPGADFRLYTDGDTCLADVNSDGVVSPTDFTAWIAAFNQMGPGCDQNGDGMCTPTDFTAWIANFNAGCD